MKIALYRKYRPNGFGELFGQDHVAQTLKNAVKSGNFSHAYLYTGPRGVGKTSVARILAKAINCEKGEKGDPCFKCESCKSITEGKEVDIVEIDAASNRGIDEIRELREKIKFTPSNLKYKVFIIDEVHMLTKEAFNALLKTLEEPPAHAIFVLATTEVHKIPQTIISRTQRFDFKRIKIKDLVDRLEHIAKKEGININGEALNIIAESSEGGFRDAISSLDQIASYKDGKIDTNDVLSILGLTDFKTLLEFAEHIQKNESKEAIILINEMVDNGYDMVQFSKNIIEFLRKLMLIKAIGKDEVELASEHVENMKTLAANMETGEISNAIEVISELTGTFKGGSVPQLPLEMAVVRLTEADASNQKLEIKNKKGEEEEKLNEPERMPFDKEGAAEKHNNLITEQPNNLSDTLEVGSKTEEAKNRKTKELSDKDAILDGSEGSRYSSKPTADQNDRGESKQSIGKKEGLWSDFLLETRSRNPQLHAYIKVTEPEFEEEKIILTFPYRFHKDKVEDVGNKKVLEEILEMVYSRPYKLKCTLKKGNSKQEKVADKADTNEKEELVNSALEIFGGEVVE